MQNIVGKQWMFQKLKGANIAILQLRASDLTLPTLSHHLPYYHVATSKDKQTLNRQAGRQANKRTHTHTHTHTHQQTSKQANKCMRESQSFIFMGLEVAHLMVATCTCCKIIGTMRVYSISPKHIPKTCRGVLMCFSPRVFFFFLFFSLQLGKHAKSTADTPAVSQLGPAGTTEGGHPKRLGPPDFPISEVEWNGQNEFAPLFWARFLIPR